MQDGRRQKILIIDDNPQDRFLYQRLLVKSGGDFEFMQCDTGEEGLREFVNFAPDCVLLDYRLPDIDGMEFLARISQICGDPCAVVVLTSQGSESVAVRALQTGAQDYLSKDSLSSETLSRAVLNAIEKVALHRELQKRTELLATANTELQQRRENLETQVEERTAELRQAHEREQELRKRAEDSNRMKDEFLALLSHELRTPLNAILGWMTVIESGKLSQEREKSALESVKRNGIALAQLIEDLLDVSGMVTGKFAITQEELDLKDVVNAALDGIRTQAEAKGLRLSKDLPQTEIRVRADAARLRQALLNVLSNAVKFSDSGGSITLRLSCSADAAVIRISDHGIGIRNEFLPFVFERFRQGDPSITRRYGGLGLGLSIVGHIMKLHGGVATAHSEGEGQGTAVTLELPLSGASQGAGSVKASQHH